MPKHNNLIFLTVLLLLTLSLFTACGTKEEPYDTDPPQLSQLSADYYSQLGITEQARQQAKSVFLTCPTIEGGELQLRLPDYWTKLYLFEIRNVDDNIIISLYDRYSAEISSRSGDLWSITRHTYEDYDATFAQKLPEAYSQIIGTNSAIIGTDEKYIYLISLPTDVRFDHEDELATDIYRTSMQAQRKIVTDFLEINHITVNEDAPELN